MNDTPSSPADVTLGEIFLAFLLIGATSFGGGVVAYLRSSLVGKHQWIDDPTFVQMLSISQTLPGLNATNMAILVGDRLRGVPGAIVAIVGVCLPGGLIMSAVGVAYGLHGDRPAVTAMLHGIAAAAIGLILAVTVQIGLGDTHIENSDGKPSQRGPVIGKIYRNQSTTTLKAIVKPDGENRFTFDLE